MIGKVVSTKMSKTAVVMVESTKTHQLYNKSFIHTKKYLVEDQIGVKDGDVVEIVKIRPISKKKHWKIEKVIGRDIVMIVEEELKEEAAEAIAEIMPEESPESGDQSQEIKEEVKEEKKTKRVKKEVKA